jgi:hypothetical protein
VDLGECADWKKRWRVVEIAEMSLVVGSSLCDVGDSVALSFISNRLNPSP